MMADFRKYTSSLLSEVVIRELTTPRGRFGLFIEHVPPFDPKSFIEHLDGYASANGPIRVSILGLTPHMRDLASSAVTTTLDVSFEAEQANTWRNDDAGGGRIPQIVLLVGSAPKVNSLRTTYENLRDSALRSVAAHRGRSLLNTPERGTFWDTIQKDESFTLPRIIEFLSAAEELAKNAGPAGMIEREATLLPILGLLPQPDLLHCVGPSELRRRLAKNRAIRDRLRTLNARDRAKLVLTARDEGLRAATAEAALQYADTGSTEHLKLIDFQTIDEILRTSITNGDAGPPRSRTISTPADAIALEILASGDREAAKGILEEAGRMIDDEDEVDTIQLESGVFRPQVRSGFSDVTAACNQLLSEAVWGGVIDAPETHDLVEALQQFATGDVRAQQFKPSDDDWPRELLTRAVQGGYAEPTVLEAWDAWAASRSILISRTNDLVDHPLLSFIADDILHNAAKDLLNRYQQVLRATSEVANSLRSAGSMDAARRLTARLLALDLIFIKSATTYHALCTPTHPFHLWHWIALHEISRDVDLTPDELAVLRETVETPPPTAPHVVLSPFAVHSLVDKAMPLIANGRLAALPVFGDGGAQLRAPDGTKALAEIAERFLRLHPHAGAGLRVAIIDPPTLTDIIQNLASLRHPLGEQHKVPVHLHVLQSRPGAEPSYEEETALDEQAADLRESGGSLFVEPTPLSLSEITTKLRSHPSHITAIFDPGSGTEFSISVADPPPLSPLVLPRAYHYDPFDDRIEVVAAGDGGPFEEYHGLFCELLERPRTDFVGRRSGASESNETLASLAQNAGWLVVLDRGLEPTFTLQECVQLDSRSQGVRDVVTFTARPEATEELIADALRLVGLVPTDAAVQELLEELTRRGSSSLIGLLRPSNETSLIEARHAKGLIGSVRAAKWYTTTYPDALVVSLDDSATRQWIVGEDEARRADLLALRPSQRGLVMEAIEIKSHDDDDTVRIDGSRIEGSAVRQVEATLRTLQKILGSSDVGGLDAARKEALRDQLFRTVASASLDSHQRRRFVELLQSLFSTGAEMWRGLVVRVRIDPNSNIPDPSSPGVSRQSPEGFDVSVIDLGYSGRSTRVGTITNANSETSAEDSERELPVGAKDETSIDPVVNLNIKPSHSSQNHDPQTLPDIPPILIGSDPAGTSVFWDPHRNEDPLRNFGFQVTGVSGSGKTQIVRALIQELTGTGVPALVLDFKNDYADRAFAKSAGLKIYDVDRSGLPFNPLTPVPDDRGLVRPQTVAYELAGILGRVFGLGDQQEAMLRNAMRASLTERGLPSDNRPVDASSLPDAPDFNEVIRTLEKAPGSDRLLNRIAPLFDLGLFPESGATEETFSDLLNGKVVLDLHSLPSDQIKSAISEFLIVRMHAQLLKGEQPRRLTRIVVLDEAHRVAQSDKLATLAREGRAFGVGLIVATQFLGDIPDNVSGNLDSKLIFQPSADDARVAARMISGQSSGGQAQHIIRLSQNLQPHQAIFTNQHHRPYVLVNTIPHYRRLSS